MNKLIKPLLVFAFLGIFSACKDDEPPLPDNLAAFESAAQGFDGEQVEVKIVLSRAAESATAISVSLTPTLLTYGTQFTTDPAATNNTLALTVPAGATGISFKVIKKTGVLLNGDESIQFKLASVAAPVLVGTNTETKLSFKAIVSDGTAITLNGIAASEAGVSAGNSVFLDLSANTQTPVLRNSWDLGFNAGTDFRVIINNTNVASAIEINKSDINAVTAADINLDQLGLGQGMGTFSLFDDVTGDLTKTVIKEISATDADNKVYVINRLGGTGAALPVDQIYKVRILRKGTTGYTLQYAKLTDTTFKTLDITKDAAYNFQFASLVTGAAVSVEPVKARWDIVWGYSIYFTGTTPYAFSDLVFLNRYAGTEAAEVLTATTTYDAFAESNLTGITFSKDRDVIGSKWRATTGTIGVKTDRFYLIKDTSGNIYKLRFVSFHANDGGERGKPKLEYKLVKKGA